MLGCVLPAEPVGWLAPRAGGVLWPGAFGILAPLDSLPRQKISLTLGNNRISELSLSDSPVCMVLQKQETLNQTNNSLK